MEPAVHYCHHPCDSADPGPLVARLTSGWWQCMARMSYQDHKYFDLFSISVSGLKLYRTKGD